MTATGDRGPSGGPENRIDLCVVICICNMTLDYPSIVSSAMLRLTIPSESSTLLTCLLKLVWSTRGRTRSLPPLSMSVLALQHLGQLSRLGELQRKVRAADELPLHKHLRYR
jgi:hypothetical protein